MLKNLLYHRVNPQHLNSVLKDGYLKSSNGIICFSRDFEYLSTVRPFFVVFDRDVLRYRWKVKPYSLFGHCRILGKIDSFVLNNPIRLEREERCFAKNIPLDFAYYYGY